MKVCLKNPHCPKMNSMNEKYKLELLNNASKVDALFDSAGEIIVHVKKIADEKDEFAVLWLLSKINNLTDSADKNLRRVLSELYNSLLLFWGNFKIDEMSKGEQISSDEKSLEELQAELNSYVGLRTVKETVDNLIAFHTVQKLREGKHLKNAKSTLHMAFIGNPGTGKTTVARIVGQMYKQIGLLSRGHFIEVSRTDLIAGYQGQTALKVKKVIEKAKGGVLFIDEAYSITENSSSDSYGRECLTELTKALEDYRDDLVVIVAGYKNPMKQFFESNPGLKSRFNTFIEFDDYDAQQLTEIFENMCCHADYSVSEELKLKVEDYFSEQVNNKSDDFSNGRLSRNIYDNLILNHAKRVITYKLPTKEDLSLLKLEDW